MKNTLPNRVRWMTSATLVVVLLLLAGCVREIERPENADPTSFSATIVPELTVSTTVVAEPSPAGIPSVLSQDSPTPGAGHSALRPRTVTATPQPEPTPSATPQPPAATPQALAPREPTPTPLVGGVISGGLFLQMTNLPKESIVHTSTISISGITTLDAVVSVNGVLVDVDAGGNFTSTLSLEQAPNLIEVVASDFQGNKVSAVLTVIYIP